MDLVKVHTWQLMCRRRHRPVFHQETNEPARAIYIFGRQTIGLPAARATASVLRKAANDIVVNLCDGNLRAL
ncbi:MULTISPECIES: hypothetical protein [Rhizobium]|uniref:Uncharacterized protein n=1 Tax=Rhizobium anhuiense TaxID=1184720 RepID=A0A3S0RI83_9HYPH|nr:MULTISPECIES: hypothetical protein [Rhizobium]MBA1344141.1 hypothetical protein [Rhizobium sp. WYCCWR 11146]RUL97097.1 hypothetical protein EEQ99_28890 [Rhizobium anhuiense]